MKKIFLILFALPGLTSYSQTESFDIATFVAPSGWQRSDANGVRVYQDYREAAGNVKFCQILIFPSHKSNASPGENFQQEWNERVAKVTGTPTRPQTQADTSPDGWTAVTGAANVTHQGIMYTCLLVTVSGFNTTMAVQVNMAGEEYASDVEKFMSTFELTRPGMKTGVQDPVVRGNTDFLNYSFALPEGWRASRAKEHIQLLQSPDDGPGCTIIVLAPQPSSGNLENDAKAVFNQMYSGWQFRAAGDKQYDLSRGYTPQGLEYFMMEAPMSKPSADGSRYDGFEDGAALVIKSGGQISIIAVRHTQLLAHTACVNKYETWRRFFNSFTIKGAVAGRPQGKAASERIVGVWKLTGNGPALGEYVFAANGNYQLTGGLGTSSTTSDQHYEYLHIRSYAFQGDGNYSVDRNQLTLAKRGDKNPEKVHFRFEEVDHGGTGWQDRLYMLKTDPGAGTQYEVCYERYVQR